MVDEADERAMLEFMSRDPKPRRVLADLIMEKIREQEVEIQSSASEAQSKDIQSDFRFNLNLCFCFNLQKR